MKGSYRELHSAIIRAGFTCSNLASAIGISPQALSHKMNGYSLFTAKEIARIGKVLNMPGKFSLSNPPFLMFLLSLSFLRPHFRFPNLCSRYPFGIRGCGLFRD